MTSYSSKDAAAVESTCTTHNVSPTSFHLLRESCAAAKDAAYCPYSRFRVGAALLLPDGSAVKGVNVENAAYPVGTCAERVAIATAVAAGTVKGFGAIAVSTDVSPPASPCGMCRQFIREFCAPQMPVIMFDKNEDYIVMTVDELLPMSFGPDKLPPPGAAYP